MIARAANLREKLDGQVEQGRVHARATEKKSVPCLFHAQRFSIFSTSQRVCGRNTQRDQLVHRQVVGMNAHVFVARVAFEATYDRRIAMPPRRRARRRSTGTGKEEEEENREKWHRPKKSTNFFDGPSSPRA